MANSSVLVNDNWCIPWTTPVYLYGLVIPGIALFIFGLTFNPIALYYFATSRHFRRSAYSYYFSAIAVVDLVRLTIWFLFLLLDFQIFKLNFYTYECSIQVFSESITSSISAWLTVALAVERCLVIYRPFQTLTDPKGKRALIVIFCVILASCAVNSLVLYPGFYKERLELIIFGDLFYFILRNRNDKLHVISILKKQILIELIKFDYGEEKHIP
jgi:hypothetical protein